jgi:pyruvate kinase
MPQVESTDAMVELVDEAVANLDGYGADDVVVIVAGSPPGAIGSVGSTNFMQVHRLPARKARLSRG